MAWAPTQTVRRLELLAINTERGGTFAALDSELQRSHGIPECVCALVGGGERVEGVFSLAGPPQ